MTEPAAPPRTDRHATLHLTLQLVTALFATPGEPFFEDLETGALRGAIDDLASELGIEAPTDLASDRTPIQASHTDLFVSSARAPIVPPYVGFAQDDELLGPTAEAVGRYLASLGIGIDPAWPDLPDHLSAVAESAALLALSGQVGEAEHVTESWLLPWFDRYATEVATRDASGLYGPLTTFLHAAIREVTRGDRS